MRSCEIVQVIEGRGTEHQVSGPGAHKLKLSIENAGMSEGAKQGVYMTL